MNTLIKRRRRKIKLVKTPPEQTADPIQQQSPDQGTVVLVPLVEIERDGDNHRLDSPASRQKIQELAD
jgi:hypothetical protein